MTSSSNDWEKTRKFISQFMRPCKEGSTCIGCEADMDVIVEHIESLLSAQREEIAEKVIRLPCTGHPNIDGILVERKYVLALLQEPRQELQDHSNEVGHRYYVGYENHKTNDSSERQEPLT